MKRKIILFITLPIVVIGLIIAGIFFYYWWDKNYNSPRFEYVCEEGYELNDYLNCVKELERVDPTPNYSCDSGYQLEDTICVKYETKKPSYKWSCPEGYKMKDGTEPQVCYKVLTELSTKNYYCDNNYVLDGTKCVRYEVVNMNKSYVCNINDFYDEYTHTCTYMYPTKTCPSGYLLKERLDNGYVKCYHGATLSYECPSDYIKQDNLCFKFFETIDAKYKTTCRSGYSLSSDGQTCTYTEYDVPSYNYQCSSGYYLENKTCVKKTTVNANINYTCSEDFTYEDGICIRYDIKKADTVVLDK